MVKATVVAVVTATPEVMTPELGDWLWNDILDVLLPGLW